MTESTHETHEGHDHETHDHAGLDHAGHDHAGHDHAGHDHGPAEPAHSMHSVAEGATLTIDDVEEAMKDVVDPELGINVVDLGLVYGIHIETGSNVVLDMTLTSAACPLTDVIQDQTSNALEGIVNDVHINWVWMPPWGPDKITDDGRDQLRALGFNV
jgi:metal-sulfur cluster biosynthetic enzyme